MNSAFKSDPTISILPLEFLEGLRLRLCVHIFPYSSSTLTYICPCGFNFNKNPYHSLGCSQFSLFRDKRHELIKRSLSSFIKSCLPSSNVTEEQLLNPYKRQDYNSSHEDLRCDIFVNDNCDIHFIDVTCNFPGTKTAIDNRSHEIPLAAANKGIKDKELKYSRYLSPAAYSRFKPFSIETTGAFSASAVAYLDKICGFTSPNKPFNPSLLCFKKKFLDQVSRILVKCNAEIVLKSRSSVKSSSLNQSDGFTLASLDI
jgi:hypothetical protein